MKHIYEFVGGKYNKQRMTYHEVMKIYNGNLSHDYSEDRNAGALVPRAELDNQPHVDGYCGPMWDGLRHIIDGREYHSWEFERLPDEAKQNKMIETLAILRYETYEVYDMLSR